MADDILNKFPIKKKREPKVIVFNEPKHSKQLNKQVTSRKRKLDNPDTQEKKDENDFINVAREVKEFGITGFTRKDQKKSKQSYAEYLGARKQKAQKVPYPILMERIKQKKSKEVKQRDLEQAMGIFKKKKKNDEEKVTQKMNLGRWVDKSNLGKLGRNRDASMRIKKSEILKVQRSKK